MNYIHSVLEYLHLKLVHIPSVARYIQCSTFATNQIQEGELWDLLSCWVPQREYEELIIAFLNKIIESSSFSKPQSLYNKAYALF